VADPKSDSDITRRRLLALGAQGAALLSGAALLNGCGSSSSSPGSTKATSGTVTTATAGGGTPRRGGTLTVGMISGGTSETINPALISQYPDVVRGYQLYDLLFSLDNDLNVQPRLAVSAEPNGAADVWTLQLRQGVTWHNGKSFTADDVVYSFSNWAQPANFGNAILAGTVDFKNVKKLGPLTVQVPLFAPTAALPSLLAFYDNFVVQDGSTKASFTTGPQGTGPFKFVSFKPGSSSVFEINPNYWEEGKPYVDRVVVDSSFTDETARLNALLSGAINVLPGIPYVEAKTQQASGQIKVLYVPGGVQPNMIDMRVDIPPFDDVRVRQAMKLLINRQEIVDSAFDGYGSPGNDLFGGVPGGTHVPYFNSSLQHPYDPEKARSLLKAAGQENFAFTLPIAPAGPGFVEAATLFAQQASAAGVKVSLQNVPNSSYFTVGPGQYLSRPIQLDGSFAFGSLAAWYRSYFATGSPLAATHWGSPEHDAVIAAAIAATDPTKAQELWNVAQQQQFDQGGEIVYANTDYVDACASSVFGLREGRQLYLNNYRLLDGWLET
jgi:peptide/nickel transport system substrate-binding protein